MWRIRIDRALPISISAQLKGQIEFGIMSGALQPGTRLPSVRELAASEGIAHVTVAHVYRELTSDGLIRIRPGQGAFVAEEGEGNRIDLTILQRLVDRLVGQAMAYGFTPSQINRMLAARLAGGQHRRPRLALVGLFSRATQLYARDLEAALADQSAEVFPCTLEALKTGDVELIDRVARADVVCTMATKVREVQALLGPYHPPVQRLSFVAHPETMARLAALPRGARLGVVSTFAEFVPTMLAGVVEYTGNAHPPLCAVLGDGAATHGVVTRAAVVIYASGCEAVLADLPPATPAIEYLHTPEPSSIESVRTLLARLFPGEAVQGKEAFAR
ncbi:MAG TPA: GntR family transcriptional regulator [Chloroflexota bacterium]|nr:GntR family transcriptional regulator [Chloroflexota bacterium]